MSPGESFNPCLTLASLAACAKKAKPTYPTPTPPAATAPSTPLPPGPSGVDQAPAGAVPGSTQDFVVNVGDRVYFDTDSHDIRSDAAPILDAQSNWLRRYPAVRVRIEGNADERGTREYNLALGARRANSVRDYLQSRGIAANRLRTVSYGEERPIADNSTAEGRAMNRRAHLAVIIQ